MKIQVILIAVSCVIVAGVACVGKPYHHIKRHSLHAPYSSLDSTRRGQATLRVRPFSAAPDCEGQFLVYRTERNEYETDFYNQFTTPPSTMVTEQVVRWFNESPLYKHVIDARAHSPSQYLMTGRVLELHGDYRDEQAPEAVIALEIIVMKEGKTQADILMKETYEQHMPMAEISVDALMRAYDLGLTNILSDAEQDILAKRLYVVQRPAAKKVADEKADKADKSVKTDKTDK